METQIREFGMTQSGERVKNYTIATPTICAEFLDYGATIRSLSVKDCSGNWVDVVLGYDTISEYENQDGYLGACIGRVGNRIGNAEFTLNGQRYPLAKNDGANHLHGGDRGFDKFVWDAEVGENYVRFTRCSLDGEEGYPGKLVVSVTYRLTDGTLEIVYDAETDKDTLCNLTNHTYWNLNGGGTVLEHSLQVYADGFLENDGGCLPTGKILNVDGTPMDFRTPKQIGKDIHADHIQLRNCGGYDHNFCLRERSGLHEAAVLHSEQTGITMKTMTTMPGLQVYSGNFLTTRLGKNGAVYEKQDAICLETQFYPNAMGCKGFEKPILRTGEKYHHVSQYAFSAE